MDTSVLNLEELPSVQPIYSEQAILSLATLIPRNTIANNKAILLSIFLKK